MKFDKIDKTLIASVALHVLVIGWGLATISSRALEVKIEDSVGVDISVESQAMAGQKTGKKEVTKPKVEKLAEAKPPAEDTVGKIDDKKPPVITETAPKEQPKTDEKAVAEAAAKAEAAKAEAAAKSAADAKAKAQAEADAREDAKAEAEEAKAEAAAKAKAEAQAKAEAAAKAKAKADAKAKTEAKAKADAQAKAEAKATADAKPKVDPLVSIAALLDKRDPSRQAVTGDTLNSNAALGTSKGKAADNSATWGALFRQQVERCWKKPYGGLDQRNFVAVFSIKLKRDGTLETAPVPLPGNPSPAFRVFQESAQRGIIECQPYRLPAAFFEEWKFFEGGFEDKGA